MRGTTSLKNECLENIYIRENIFFLKSALTSVSFFLIKADLFFYDSAGFDRLSKELKMP